MGWASCMDIQRDAFVIFKRYYRMFACRQEGPRLEGENNDAEEIEGT